MILTDSGPITVTQNNQVIEELRITTSGTPGITVNGFSGVTIRNCEILHASGKGIEFNNADDLTIEDSNIVLTNAPASGALPSKQWRNINGANSDDVTIQRVRLTRGSSGIYAYLCPRIEISNLEGYDFRGPFPRGQTVQLNGCPNAVIQDFYSLNEAATSWPEDNISVYASPGTIVRRGHIDGNNAKSGVGVMVEDGSDGTLVEDVDSIRMMNGAFSAYPSTNTTFRRCRTRENICTDQGRGAPLSGGLLFASAPGSVNTRFDDCSYWLPCKPNNILWDASTVTLNDITEEEFTMRTPVTNTFDWEGGGDPGTPTVPDAPTSLTATAYTADANLVHEWTFDEGTGTAAANTGQETLTAELQAAATWNGGGKFGGDALLVTAAASSHALVADDASWSFSSSDAFSLSLFLRIEALPNAWSCVFQGGTDGAGPKISLYIRPTNNLYAGWSFAGLADSSTCPVGEWVHAVIVQDPSDPSDKVQLWVNGVMVNSTNTAQDWNGAGPLYIGSRNATTTENFAGAIDHFQIYDKALTPAEIASIGATGSI
jgi:hypothetical protein